MLRYILNRVEGKIAVASDYALETINSYLKSAVRKLGASNRVEAVAEALGKRQLIHRSRV
jgi:LuxR family transcriptional regulator